MGKGLGSVRALDQHFPRSPAHRPPEQGATHAHLQMPCTQRLSDAEEPGQMGLPLAGGGRLPPTKAPALSGRQRGQDVSRRLASSLECITGSGEPIREVDSWVRTTGQTFLGGHPEPAILMCQTRHGQSWHKWLSAGKTWASSLGEPERS